MFLALGALPILAAVLSGFGAASLLGMLHLPRRDVEPVPGALPTEIQAAGGALLKASWLPSQSADACVLFLHGLGGTRDRVNRFLPAFRTAGYAILAPDSRAQGESGGDTITYGVLEKHDTIAWARWMREQGCTAIYGLGESLGASVLIDAAAVEPVFRAIVADAAYADLLDEAEHRGMRLFPFPRFVAAPMAQLAVAGGSLYARLALNIDFRQASPVRSITRTQTPILLIHGEADNRTPPEHSRRLAAAAPATTDLWIVPGAGHVRSFRTAPEEYTQRMLDWFAAH
jgi:fermentation-respiration switch protein FrsA (DUF1100 family)